MTIIIEKFRNLDFFAIHPSFFFQSSPTIKTLIGAIISLIIILYTTFLTFYFGSELILKNQPSLNSYKDFSRKEQNKLNVTNFIMAIIIEGADKNIIDFKEDIMYSYSIVHEFSVQDDHLGNVVSKEIKLIPCKKEYFQGFAKMTNYTLNRVLKYGNCIDLNNNILQGSPLYNIEYQGVKIQMQYNSTKYFDEYDIYEKIFPLKVQIYYQSFLYEIKNYKDPFKKELGVSEYIIYPNYDQSYYFLFTNAVSKRNDDVFFNNVNETNIYGFSQVIQSSFFFTDGGDEDLFDMLRIKINFEPFALIYYRRYQKLQEILAQIVSFSNVGLIFGELVIRFLARREIIEILSKTYFERKLVIRKISKKKCNLKIRQQVNFPDSTFSPINQHQTEFLNIKGTQSGKDSEKTFTPKKEKIFTQFKSIAETDRPSFEKIYKKESNNSKGVFNKITSMKKSLCFCRNKKKLENSKVCQALEIGNLLNNYEEMKRLQVVLFNTHQFFLFKHLSNCSSVYEYRNQIFEDSQKLCSEYFSGKISKGILSEIDKRLIDLMTDQEKDDLLYKYQCK